MSLAFGVAAICTIQISIGFSGVLKRRTNLTEKFRDSVINLSVWMLIGMPFKTTLRVRSSGWLKVWKLDLFTIRVV